MPTYDEIAGFVRDNINNPKSIFDAMNQFGVTPQQVADATGYTLDDIGGYLSPFGGLSAFSTTVQTPAVKTPTTQTPTVQTPVVKTPTTQTPTVQTPAVKTPTTQTPVVQLQVDWAAILAALGLGGQPAAPTPTQAPAPLPGLPGWGGQPTTPTPTEAPAGGLGQASQSLIPQGVENTVRNYHQSLTQGLFGNR